MILFSFFSMGMDLADSQISTQNQSLDQIEVEWPYFWISGVENEIVIRWAGEESQSPEDGLVSGVNFNGEEYQLVWRDAELKFSAALTEKSQYRLSAGTFNEQKDIHPIPLWWSIVPPLLAIALALIFREVLSSLFAGIFVGTAIIGYFSEGVIGIFIGFFKVIEEYILNALTNPDRLSVILFTSIIGGLVALVSKNGGMQGVVNRMSKLANSARNAQFTTWLLGCAIFFDDYANTLVVGSTMRPLTDRWRISREKLSYLVDSTAAPVAAIAFVTTWIGAELGYIGDGVNKINSEGFELTQGAYGIFLSSLQFSFYPIFTLVFMLMLIFMRKDFGPMYKAEIRARVDGKVSSVKSTEHVDEDEMKAYEPAEGVKIRSWNAVVPIAVVIFGTVIGLLLTGWDDSIWADSELSFTRKLSAVIGNSNSYVALLWSSLLGLVVAIGMTVGGRQLNLHQAMTAVVNGFKFMMHAILILTLAWTLADVTDAMHTADFLQNAFGHGIAPWLIPAVTFILAALVSFSTGSSWGTMAILYPLILPLSWSVAAGAGYEHAEILMIFYNTVACVLAGSVLGDHCSPISDTTILSSLATSCHHIDHVRTQMPYALMVGGVSLAVGIIPGALGVPFWISFPVGIILFYLILKYFGKDVPEPSFE